MDFTLKLTEAQTNLVIGALKKLPMEQVEATVISIVEQATGQIMDAKMHPGIDSDAIDSKTQE